MPTPRTQHSATIKDGFYQLLGNRVTLAMSMDAAVHGLDFTEEAREFIMAGCGLAGEAILALLEESDAHLPAPLADLCQRIGDPNFRESTTRP